MRGGVTRTPEQVRQHILSRLVESDSGCLLWTGATFNGVYGLISWKGKHLGVHRTLWEVTYGKLAEGLYIDHICHNKLCANLQHLQAVTTKANSQNRKMTSKASNTGVLNVRKVDRLYGDRYEVRMRSDNKDHYFGGYSTLEEAKEVAIQKRRELFSNSHPEIATNHTKEETKCASH